MDSADQNLWIALAIVSVVFGIYWLIKEATK